MDIKDALVRQLTNPVRWDDSMQFLVTRDLTHLLRSDQAVLSGLQKRIAKELNATVDVFNVEDLDSFKKTVELLKII